MNILILNDRLYPDFVGGVERRNFDLAAALARRGHRVTLAGFGSPDSPSEEFRREALGPMKRIYSTNGKRSVRAALRYAARVCRTDVKRFDVVETSNIPFVHIPLLALRCRMSGVPLIVTWYELWGPYWREYVGAAASPLYRAIEWLTAQFGTEVTSISRLTAGRVTARRKRGGPVHLVPCAIHLDQLLEVKSEPVRSGPPVIYAGRLIAEKRVDLLLRAFAIVRSVSDATLVVYGEGPCLPALRELAFELGIAPAVEFREHVDDVRDVWRAIRSAKVAVQPSSREGFGMFPLEAMALGRPVVYCRSSESAVGEIVRDRVDGLCTEPDPASLAAAIWRILDDGALREALGTSAASRALAYDWDLVAGMMDSIITSAAAQGQAAAERAAT